MMWQTVEVANKQCDIFEPSAPGPFALIHLHGVGQETLADNAAWTPLFEQHALRVICPHGKRSWWTNRVCREFDDQLTSERFVVDHVLEFLRQRWQIEPPRIALSGISMGGQGALRLAMKYASRFPVVAAISAAIDYQRLHGQGSTIDEMYADAEAVRQDTAPLYVHPLNWPRHILMVVDPTDPWLDGNQQLHEKLAALGILHEYDFQTAGGGHSWRYFNAMAPRVVNFVLKGLEAESRRVV